MKILRLFGILDFSARRALLLLVQLLMIASLHIIQIRGISSKRFVTPSRGNVQYRENESEARLGDGKAIVLHKFPGIFWE